MKNILKQQKQTYSFIIFISFKILLNFYEISNIKIKIIMNKKCIFYNNIE